MQKLRLVYFAISNQGLYYLPYQNQGLYTFCHLTIKACTFLPSQNQGLYFLDIYYHKMVFFVTFRRVICAHMYILYMQQEIDAHPPIAHFVKSLGLGNAPQVSVLMAASQYTVGNGSKRA